MSAQVQLVSARFPWVLFVPLATVTEIGGILLLRAGDGIGWAAMAAPLVGFLAMRGPVRPRFEFTNDGVTFRKSASSPMLPWDEIEDVALLKAGGRRVLAYRLKPGVVVSRRHPGAGFLRAKGLDYDGGYFVDQMNAEPEKILAIFKQHLGK